MDKLCDLHTHSYYSDGTVSPAELIGLARQAELGAVALCDHNTVAGLPEFAAAGENLDDSFDFIDSADDRIELACTGGLRQVSGILIDCGRIALVFAGITAFFFLAAAGFNQFLAGLSQI